MTTRTGEAVEWARDHGLPVELVNTSGSRPTLPEVPLSEDELTACRRAAAALAQPHHRIYLGMAPGVGKTYAALHELRRRAAAGADVVIAYVETYSRAGTITAIGDLELVPRRKIAYKGCLLEEMDLDEVLLRHPDVALVDELAHSNVPGCRHAKRWQDAEELLRAGVSVISTLNIQHLESLADIVSAVTGVEVRERIPDHVVDEADEIELVDLSPRALRRRIEQGEVYPTQRAEDALRMYFREGNLTALRELALRTVSTEVEKDLEAFMREHGINAVWPAGERVVVGVNEQPASQKLLRRGWRMSNHYGADLLAAFVETPEWVSSSAEQRGALEENLHIAEDLGAKVLRIESSDVAHGLLRLARENNVADLVVGHSRHGRLHELLGTSVANSLVRLTEDVDIHVVAVREKS
jgi:two-component system sensor histidine kinase KdpD